MNIDQLLLITFSLFSFLDSLFLRKKHLTRLPIAVRNVIYWLGILAGFAAVLFLFTFGLLFVILWASPWAGSILLQTRVVRELQLTRRRTLTPHELLGEPFGRSLLLMGTSVVIFSLREEGVFWTLFILAIVFFEPIGHKIFTFTKSLSFRTNFVLGICCILVGGLLTNFSRLSFFLAIFGLLWICWGLSHRHETSGG